MLWDSLVINLMLACFIHSKPVLICVWHYCPGQSYSCWFEVELKKVEVVLLLIHYSSQFMQYQCCHCQNSPGAWWYHHHTGSVLIHCFWVWKPQLYASNVLSRLPTTTNLLVWLENFSPGDICLSTWASAIFSRAQRIDFWAQALAPSQSIVM